MKAGQAVPFLSGGAQDEAKTKGPASAKIQIVDFSDFQCPACKRALPILEGFTHTYPGQIQIVFKHYPLSGHKWSKLAHQSAECAAQAGRFWLYHDLIYKKQDLWTNSKNPTPAFIQYAKQSGINVDNFAGCLVDPKITNLVYDEKAEGDKQRVRSTPTFFINGKRFVGAKDLKFKGEAFIREELGLEPLPQEPPPPPLPTS